MPLSDSGSKREKKNCYDLKYSPGKRWDMFSEIREYKHIGVKITV